MKIVLASVVILAFFMEKLGVTVMGVAPFNSTPATDVAFALPRVERSMTGLDV